jgi:hypothetical protein
MYLSMWAALTACGKNPRQPASTAAPAEPPAEVKPSVSAVETGRPNAASTAGVMLSSHAGLRFDCTRDSDCTIMDIGNCCGHYPACVHEASKVDPRAVARECAEKGLAGICGYPVLSACECRAGRCEGVTRPIGEEAQR